MSIFLLLLLLSIDGRSSVRIALCKAFKLFEGSLHLQVLLPLFREHELSHFRVGMFVKVSDHIIEHRVLLRQIICEFAAEFPPRFGRSIGRGLDLAVGQEIKHLALVLLYMFAAHLIGHIPRNFLVIIHAVATLTPLLLLHELQHLQLLVGRQLRVPEYPSSEVDGQVGLGVAGVVGKATHAVHLAVGIEEGLVGEGSEADGAFQQFG